MSDRRDENENACLITVEEAEERRLLLNQITRLLWLFNAFLEVTIGLRIFLKLIAANPDVLFAKVVYSVTDVFLLPFFGLTITPSIGRSVLEISSMIAMAVYALLTLGVVRLMKVLFSKEPTE